ncbi:MAG: CHASE2 domain-containing protein [Fibrobacterota bacterium]
MKIKLPSFKKILKKTVIGALSGVLLALFSSFFIKYILPDFWVNLENKTYDLRYQLKYADQRGVQALADGVQTASRYDDVVIINIDERSMLADNLGVYYKWPRSYHGEVVEYLKSGNNASTTFDIHFNDADYGLKETERILGIFRADAGKEALAPGEIAKLGPVIHSGVNYDSMFVASTRRAGNVIHAMILNDTINYANKSDYIERTTEAHRLASNPGSAFKMEESLTEELRHYPVLDGAFPELAQAADRIALVNVSAEDDGIHRKLPLLNKFRGYVYPALSLQTCLRVMGKTLADVKFIPGTSLDMGRPFYLRKDKAGVLSVSYPGVSGFMVRALLEKAPAVAQLKDGGSLSVTEKVVVLKDAAGALKADLLQGMLSFSSIKDLNGITEADLLKLPMNEPAPLSDATGILRTGEELFTLVEIQNNEKAVEEIPLSSLLALAALDGPAVMALKPGESLTACQPLTVSKKEGELRTEYVILRNDVMDQLLKMRPEELDAMAPGQTREFGEPLLIPVDLHGRMRINFLGLSQRTFKTISYYDIKAKRVPADYFCGKLFLVGSDAPSMFDIVSAPADANYPGVELHATVMTDILNRDFMRDPDDSTMLLVMMLLCVIVAILAFLVKPFISIGVTLLASLTYFVVALGYFQDQNLNLEIVRPVFGMFTCFLAGALYRYITEERDKQFLKATFQNYLSVELIDQMYESKQVPQLGGDEGIRTAYFTDIQGFSTFSEKLGSPTKLVELLNEYLTAQTDILMDNGGTLDKYEGDAIIAFFGAPMPLPDHAEKGCLTAIKMQRTLGDLRVKWVSEGDKWPAIVHGMRMRIGVNSGPIVTGNMGSKKRMNYTMMGDTVNLAARLESAAKQYGVFTMISHFTRDMIGDAFEIRELDKITVVGKSEPITVFELIEEKGKIEPRVAEMVQIYLEALGFYKKQEWDKAIALFEKSLILEIERYPDQKTNPSKVYVARCHEFKLNPPGADWSGVYELTSK